MAGNSKMAESIEETLREGFWDWRRNLVLGVPSLLSAIFLMGILVLSAVLFVVSIPFLRELPQESIVLVAIIYPLIVFFVLVVSNAFFTAAAVGMAVDAVESGATRLEDMVAHGKRKVAAVTALYLLAISFMAVLVVVCAILPIWSLYAQNWNLLVFFSLLGVAVISVSFTLLLILWSFIFPAMFVEDTGPLGGIKSAYSFVLNNKLKVFILISAGSALSAIFSQVYYSLTGFLTLTQYISPVIYLPVIVGVVVVYILISMVSTVPLTTVWFARTYISGTGGKIKKKATRKKASKPPVQKKSRAKPSELPELYV